MSNSVAKQLEEHPLVPMVGEVSKIVDETPDVKTFHIYYEQGKPFTPMPGQVAMLSLLSVGEAMFSVRGVDENHLEFSLKKTGILTDALHEIEEGQKVGVRGPYGNGFPIDFCKGKDMLFIGMGIGLAPVRTMIYHCINNREDYGKMQIIYGARSPQDLVFKEDLFENWHKVPNCGVDVTVDRGDDDWDGNVGFVPPFVEGLAPNPENTVAIICGPPIGIKFTLPVLEKLGFTNDQIITTLEMRMKCGIGKCGRCNIGSCYVCLDGPVFSLEQLKVMPDEY
ncbi:FAD/NAD(P)-binding protein [Metallumcola ferriviriculae]|uniref:FAD/NAD(P)-binding protein n=1 Tax=Metallumcola ferriviriculae TaxID=3039180 RepID=A0AAU0UP23_9FIRM|nr:FAD/NAD(P)-binding protein [Desulfitibacteraceae bacterium MK1]